MVLTFTYTSSGNRFFWENEFYTTTVPKYRHPCFGMARKKKSITNYKRLESLLLYSVKLQVIPPPSCQDSKQVKHISPIHSSIQRDITSHHNIYTTWVLQGCFRSTFNLLFCLTLALVIWAIQVLRPLKIFVFLIQG